RATDAAAPVSVSCSTRNFMPMPPVMNLGMPFGHNAPRGLVGCAASPAGDPGPARPAVGGYLPAGRRAANGWGTPVRPSVHATYSVLRTYGVGRRASSSLYGYKPNVCE